MTHSLTVLWYETCNAKTGQIAINEPCHAKLPVILIKILSKTSTLTPDWGLTLGGLLGRKMHTPARTVLQNPYPHFAQKP